MSFDYEHLRELFSPLGEITFKKMFGGLAIYHHGFIIACFFDDGMLLKSDEVSEPYFLEAGCEPWTYTHKNTLKITKMPYHSMPEVCYDDFDAMKIWATRAFEASQRIEARKPKKKPI